MEPCSEWEPEITVGVKGQRQSQWERKGRGGPEEGLSESQEAKPPQGFRGAVEAELSSGAGGQWRRDRGVFNPHRRKGRRRPETQGSPHDPGDTP